MASHTSQSGAAAAPKPPQEFDPEIVDMAKYAYNYKVDSDLAVRLNESKEIEKRTGLSALAVLGISTLMLTTWP